MTLVELVPKSRPTTAQSGSYAVSRNTDAPTETVRLNSVRSSSDTVSGGDSLTLMSPGKSQNRKGSFFLLMPSELPLGTPEMGLATVREDEYPGLCTDSKSLLRKRDFVAGRFFLLASIGLLTEVGLVRCGDFDSLLRTLLQGGLGCASCVLIVALDCRTSLSRNSRRPVLVLDESVSPSVTTPRVFSERLYLVSRFCFLFFRFLIVSPQRADTSRRTIPEQTFAVALSVSDVTRRDY